MFEWLKRKGKEGKKANNNTPSDYPENTISDCTPLTGDLNSNLELIEQSIGQNPDVVIRRLKSEGSGLEAAIIYIDGLANPETIQEHVIKPLLQEVAGTGIHPGTASTVNKIMQSIVTAANLKEFYTLDECIPEVLSGSTALLFEGSAKALILSSPGWQKRSPSEPISEPSVRGARDGFVETLQENIVRLRRRIKDPNFTIIKLKIGRRTKNGVAVTYIRNIANQELVKEVLRRIKRIDIDGVITSGTLEQLIEDNFMSPFPQIQYTERPDKVVSEILEGRIGILVDNTPFALIVPATFPMFMQAPGDYYDRWIYSSLIRILRYIALFFSMFLPAIYVALISYHQGLIPTKLAIFIAATREGVPFPSLIEALIMETTLEILREAGVRLPKSIGQAVGIVGGLVIGEAAVRAGIVSPIMVVVVALTAVASFSVPHYAFGIPIRILRFVLILAAGILGLYGVMLVFIMLTVHLVKLKSFGVPYSAPFAPYQPGDWKDLVLRLPIMMMKKRPEILKTRDKKRQ
jgi:spore germination protein